MNPTLIDVLTFTLWIAGTGLTTWILWLNGERALNRYGPIGYITWIPAAIVGAAIGYRLSGALW
mgnify:FL=1